MIICHDAATDGTATAAGSVGNAGANGNRTTVTDTVGGSTTSQVLCHDAADRLLKATGGPWGTGMSPTYDDRGNTLAIGGQTFAWDAGDRSVGAASGSTNVTWARDAAGRVASRTTGVTSSKYSYTGPGDAAGSSPAPRPTSRSPCPAAPSPKSSAPAPAGSSRSRTCTGTWSSPWTIRVRRCRRSPCTTPTGNPCHR